MPTSLTALPTRPWPTCTSHVPLHCSAAALVELLGGVPDAAAVACDEVLPVQRVPRGAPLVHEGARAAAVYVVQSGSFKRVKTAEDGYEHVLGFAWRRDLLGYDGLADGHYAFSEVALEDSRVVALPPGVLETLRHRVPALDTALQTVLARQLAAAGEIAETMAAVAADVRLARFLVRLSARMAERGESPRRLLLRMNRRDIANHLGLAHETVSRSFGVLADGGWLHVDNRDVEILDLDALRRCARSTRGTADDGLGRRAALACAA
jgi:CRP/FNR family transcriptional regulator